MLRIDDVCITIARELDIRIVARFARSAVTNRVRQDNEVAIDIQRAAGSEERIGESGTEKLQPASNRAVKEQNSVAPVAVQSAQCAVCQPQICLPSVTEAEGL